MVSADAISASLTKAAHRFMLQFREAKIADRPLLAQSGRLYPNSIRWRARRQGALSYEHPQASRACSKIRPDPRGTHFGSGCTIADGVETADLEAAKAHLNSLQ
jgi:hypothetical protein